MDGNTSMPILIPLPPEEFWMKIQMIVKEELSLMQKKDESDLCENIFGLNEKSLLKVSEVCMFFSVSKTTIYDWIKKGKLKRLKVGSRVYFLRSDIRDLIAHRDHN